MSAFLLPVSSGTGHARGAVGGPGRCSGQNPEGKLISQQVRHAYTVRYRACTEVMSYLYISLSSQHSHSSYSI